MQGLGVPSPLHEGFCSAQKCNFQKLKLAGAKA